MAPCKGNVSANRMQSDGGFEPVAPCKGNGISAQGKVNVVNGTLGSPHVPGLKSIAPCRGSTSRIGATPPRHTRAQIGMQPDFAEGNN